ncbi:MAG: hypothetical protein M1824_002739 [Vezdaea acicularis]|nr:MAG: hypothetical protein M1824_002739 [Vezdaea acicularis]
MSDHHEVTMGDIDDHHEGPTTAEKGKMKIPETHDASMGEDEEESSDEETGAEDAGHDDDEEEDGINEEIDPSNIVGSRTRGKKIDFRKAATEAGDELEEDEDDDDDFQAPAEHGHDAMEE